MNEDRHINFKLMRDRILAAELKDAQSDRRALPIYPGNSEFKEKKNKTYWRSLEELVDAPEFRELVEREFPQQAEGWDDPVERRTFLKLMGASLALAGLSGCVYQPPEKIVPYINQPEEEVPGKGLFFATAATLGGVATPVLARSNEGRPTKIEGNADHPNYSSAEANARPYSATDIFAQASVLSLYDPDRSQTPLYRDEPRPWTTFVGEIRTALNGPDGSSGLRAKQGAGLRFLSETIVSPTLAAQVKEILTALPQAKWHQYEPVNQDNAYNGAMMAFGQAVNTIYDFSKAERVLSLDSDFLSSHPGMLRYARDFAARRRVTEGRKEMNRLYVIESTPSLTGAKADHRWAVKPSEVEGYAFLLSTRLPALQPGNGPASQPLVVVRTELVASTSSPEVDQPHVDAIVNDLKQHQGACIVIPGREASPLVHALAHSMNAALGNIGKTVFYTDPLEATPVDQTQSLRELVTDIDSGRVEMLVILGGNPTYNTPADLRLNQERLFKVALRVHHGAYKDETAELCHWHVPATHYLESWSDTRSVDGTVSIVQPLIEPLYESKSEHELLAVFSDQYDRKAYDIIRDNWRAGSGAVNRPQPVAAAAPAAGAGGANGQRPVASPSPATATATPTPAANSTDFDGWWRKCLHDGFIPNSAFTPKNLTPKSVAQTPGADTSGSSSGYEVVFRADPSIYDGRFANNGWLQELPRPLTKITWDNAALVSPKTAAKLGVGKRPAVRGRESYVDTIKLGYGGNTISGTVPVFIMPGQPDDVITVHLGYGRRRAGRVGNGHGFDAYEIRPAASPWFVKGAEVSKASSQHVLATTQLHFNMEDYGFKQAVGLKDDRDILRIKTLADYLKEKPEDHESEDPPKDETLYDPELYNYENQGERALNYAWGMAIDLNGCVGCNACTIACQSENNIPVVGKTEVERSREMHWIRVDAYFSGESDKPAGPFFQPVPCMHCENAPCEPVCPVHATVHSAEGLNDMVYNRCVGTKYCSNNCPYKVRRFNFFLYQDWDTPTYQLMRNPDVSVRSRGVMEKCTYCVQRIQSAKIHSEIEGRPVKDGEIVTACQAVCPTEAIVFGNINDPNSRVSKMKAEQRSYGLLTELNTRPRTTYLSALRNPNPEIGE
ncbi:MAG TPA: TAT-variant-translocated molybdopterin oxidoreductase [Pyrinomonadaceae bacterium]|nr:TAT-variant-translocated molybdopterin oxidoreductase [Pyrinomonadaceae bacterium]